MRIAQYTVLTLLLTAALFLASCQIGKPYARPEMQLPEQLDTLQQDSTTIADYKWWEIYSDTTLQRLIDQALEYNKDLNMAASRVRQLAQMKRIDFAEFFPQFDAHISSEDENMNYGGDNLDMDFEHQTLVDIAWEIDLWGNLRWKRDISMAEFLASIENQRALQMSIIAQVAESYFELVALDNELSIVQQTLEARKEGLHLAHIRFTGGLTSEMAYQQANVELAKTMTLVPDLERRIEKKESEIAFLTGSFPKRIERNRLPEEISLPDTLPVGLPSTLLERRPDIRRAEQQLVAANAAVGASYTDMFPRLRLTSHLGLESDALKTFLVSPYTFVYGIIGAPIFEFGKNRAMWRAKQAAYEEAVYAYEKAVLKAFKEVHNAIVDFHKIAEIYESRLQLEQASKTAVELAQLQYINGVIRYIDVLDAQRKFFDAQIEESTAVRNEHLALVRLYKALGVFIPLIVVNCIILGRAEAFASKNSPFDSMLDGVGIGLGFTLSLTVIGAVREVLGSGAIFGMSLGISNYMPLVFILAPGGFLTLGYLMVLFNKLVKK